MSQYISSTEIINKIPPAARVFQGLDGRWLISDKHGTHVASPLAVALLNRAEHRAAGYRAEVDNE